MLLKDELKTFDIPEVKLLGFRNAVTMQFNRYRSELYNSSVFELDQNGENDPDFALSHDYTYQYQHNEISSSLVDEVLIELGLFNSKLKLRTNHITEYECLSTNYSLIEFWHLLTTKLSEFEFFVSMVILMREVDSRRSTRKLAEIVSREIKRFDISLPNKSKDNVFIAMSFDPSLMEIRSVLHEVIRQFQLEPIFMDEKEHNNQIVPEMIMEIEESVLVVAELTQHKHGVYYEAGFAHALGKEVVFCCKDTDYESIHFDISHTNIIRWIHTDDLKKKMYNRLKVTLFNLNKKEGNTPDSIEKFLDSIPV